MKEVLTPSTLLKLAAIAGLLGLPGCPYAVSSHPEEYRPVQVSTSTSLSETPTSDIQAPSSPTLAQAASNSSVAAVTCARVQNWQQLSEAAHLQELEAMPRYGKAIYDAPLKQMLGQFRDHPVIHFTTYGLSARIEPNYLSGIWPVMDSLGTCYEGSAPERINTGQIGEIWLMNYEFVSLDWSGSAYRVHVRERDQGLEIVQFERQESAAMLPITILTPEGQEVEHMSGDW